MDSANANLIGILLDRAASLFDEGNYAEAFHAANAAVDSANTLLDTQIENVDAYVKCLELRGDVQKELGYYTEAKDDYLEGLDLYDNRPDRQSDMGRLHANLGAVADLEGNSEEAQEHWEKAIFFFEQNDPPLELDIAAMANNLGFLHRQAGRMAEAEGYFLQALEYSHSNLGQEHEQTATICSNLGVLYLATGLHEQAREMHMMALDARRAIFGESHPDTAQSHNNLALALICTGDRSWARRHFEKALEALELLGSEFAEDLEAVAGNYCDFLREEGEENLATKIEGRVRDLIGA